MDNEQRVAVDAMWANFREGEEMICDAPSRKIGMPLAAPYSVSFPVEIDGDLVFVDLDVDEVQRLAHGLLAKLPLAIEMTEEAEAAYGAHEAICRAREA